MQRGQPATELFVEARTRRGRAHEFQKQKARLLCLAGERQNPWNAQCAGRTQKFQTAGLACKHLERCTRIGLQEHALTIGQTELERLIDVAAAHSRHSHNMLPERFLYAATLSLRDHSRRSLRISSSRC